VHWGKGGADAGAGVFVAASGGEADGGGGGDAVFGGEVGG